MGIEITEISWSHGIPMKIGTEMLVGTGMAKEYKKWGIYGISIFTIFILVTLFAIISVFVHVRQTW